MVYGVSYFFTEFGPNSTTFVYPAEIFPVEGRTTGHGIASAAGKLGGFIGVFLFPILLGWHGLLAAESAAATVSVLGIVVTLTMLPETKGAKPGGDKRRTRAGIAAATSGGRLAGDRSWPRQAALLSAAAVRFMKSANTRAISGS